GVPRALPPRRPLTARHRSARAEAAVAGMSQDPFDELRDRLIVAAGGTIQTSRRGVIALAVALAVLVVGAVTAFALTRGDDKQDPVARATPTPARTPTPTASLPPLVTPQATPRRPRQARPGSPAPNATPVPTPTPQYDIDFQ